MAPAMTLKRMYHCVPSSMSAMEPMPRPPPMRTSREQDGKKRGGGNGSRDLRQRLRDARQARIEADGHADGNGPQRGDEQRDIDAQEGGAGALEQLEDFGAVQLPQQQHGMKRGEDGGDQQREEDRAVGDERALPRCGAALRPRECSAAGARRRP